MKRFLTVMLAALLVVAITAPVLAWEFSLKGEYEYRLKYFGRTGTNDLFGVSTLQDNGVANSGTQFVGLAGPNIYGTGAANPVAGDLTVTSGVQITRGGFSRYESDAFWDDQRLTLHPEFRVNPAIRVHGVYNIGGLRNKYLQRDHPNNQAAGVPPLERYYMQSMTGAASYNTAAIGSWEQYRATIQTPMFLLSIGAKDFPFGTGASLGYNVRGTSFLTIVPYGPFRFLHAYYLASPVVSATIAHNSVADSYIRPTFRQGAGITYSAGDLELYLLGEYRKTHVGARTPAAAAPPGAAAVAWTAGNASDTDLWTGVLAMKYFNGRFFANVEYQWNDSWTHRLYNTNLTNLNIYSAAPSASENYLAFAEAGCVCGPAKLSLLYARASGPVLNNGWNYATTRTRTKTYGGLDVNYQAMQPYQYLMFDVYAGGNQAFFHDGTGEMTDAFAYAGRLDYAVASNLNFWGSYLWAHRLEKAGTFKGHYTNTGASAAAGATLGVWNPIAAPASTLWNDFVAAGGTNPYVEDGFLGWEANIGADWKLLEGLTMTLRYSYWAPGEWFADAYQSIVPIAGGGVALDGKLNSRDAINAFSGSLLINF